MYICIYIFSVHSRTVREAKHERVCFFLAQVGCVTVCWQQRTVEDKFPTFFLSHRSTKPTRSARKYIACGVYLMCMDIIYAISGRIFVFRSRSARGATGGLLLFPLRLSVRLLASRFARKRSLSFLSFAPRRPDRRPHHHHLGSCCRDGACCRGNDVTRGVEWRIPSARRTECKAYI